MSALELIKGQIGKEFSESPSPFMHWLKPSVKRAERGSLEFEYQIRGEWLNPVGNLHGGVTAAIIDDILGATLCTFDEPSFYSTINNVIDYFSTATLGETIVAKTRILKKGRQFVNAECEIWNASETRLIAKGHSNLFKTEPKKS